MASIDFYFEFSSPYGYIASEKIVELAARHGRTVRWYPFLLGAVFKQEGTQPLVGYPMKGPYSKHDIERSTAFHEIPFRWPPKFPVYTVNACRAAVWALRAAPDQAVDLIQAIYRKAFDAGEDIGHVGPILDAAESAGLDRDAVEACIKSQDMKTYLRDWNQAAIDRGVFGSPFFFIDEEPFWGADRMEMMDAWMTRGGW